MPTLCKEERLHNNKLIHQLHQEGFKHYQFPLLAKWIVFDSQNSFNVAFLPVVAKRNIKKAVNRNKIKRLIREAYRISKDFLIEKAKLNNKSVVIMLLYNGKEILPYEELKTKVELSLKHIEKSL